MRIDRCKGCGEQIDIASDHKPECTTQASRRVSASMAEVIRLELRKGSYQMPGDTLPYETQAAKIAEVLAANGYGKLEDAWYEGACAYETRRARDESLPLTNPYRTKEN